MASKFVVCVLLLALVGAQAATEHRRPAHRRPATVLQLVDALIAKGLPFTTLKAAIEAADPSVAQLLGNPKFSGTVFAPTNQAFTQFLADKGLTLDALVGNQQLLTDVLTLHVTLSSISSRDIRHKPSFFRSLYDQWTGIVEAFRVGHYRRSAAFLKSAGNPDRNSRIITPDLRAGRAIVHAIDYPLFQGLPVVC